MKFQFILEHPEFSTYLQCRVLGVSKSGFYDWRGRPESTRDREDKRLIVKLKNCFNESGKTYGIMRLTTDLNELGESINHKRVARIKKVYSIYPKQHKAFVITTDSTHLKPVAPNILNREFKVGSMNKVWVSDITYIATQSGWNYLAVIIDLYSRKVVGWQLAKHMKAELVCDALEMAKIQRGCLPKLFHSDRGIQYVSDDLGVKLEGVTISMSRKGNCWDNACAESFFGTLKTEHVKHQKYQSIIDARISLFQYIEGFYNRKRRHSTLGNISPSRFEEKEV